MISYSSLHPIPKPQRATKAWLNQLFAFLVLVLFSGCATVQSKPKADVNLSEYRRIFIPAVEEDEDPRKAVPKVVDRLRAMGFEVIAMNKGEAITSQGSGLVVDSLGHVLTCSHVLGGKTNATAWIGKQRFEANVVNSNTNKDMALLKLQLGTNVLTPLSFASTTNLSMGQDVFTLGFPLSDLLGSAPRLTKGLLSSTVGLEDDPDYVQISAEVQSGNSGGPLLNNRGEVIGLVTATLNPLNVLARTGTSLPQNVNFAAKGPIVREFLASAGISPRIAEAAEDSTTFERVKESVVLVRAGNIPSDADRQKEMLCSVKYVYFWDMWHRFRAFQLDFVDLKKGELILRVGQYGDKVFTGEDAVIDRVLEEVQTKFFPDRPVNSSPKPKPQPSGNRR